MVPFPSSCQNPEGIFLWYLLLESSQVPGGKCHHIMRGLLKFPWSYELSDLSTGSWISSSTAGQIFRPVNGSWGGFHVSSLLRELWLFVFPFLSLQSWGQCLALCPPLSYRSEKSSWFFCSAFYYLLGRCGTFNLISCGIGKRSLCSNFWLAVGCCECRIVECLDLLLSFKECWHLFCKWFMLLSEQLHFFPSFIS